MINIRVNDETFHTESHSLSAFLLAQKETFAPPFAVAVNGEFVPQTAYEQTPLNEGDTIDIVSPIGGG